jgi:hypothetical protein
MQVICTQSWQIKVGGMNRESVLILQLQTLEEKEEIGRLTP